MVNASVTQTEGVSVHGVDHIAAMVSERMKQLRRKGGAHCQLLGKCWDLAAAYKQVPLSDEAYDMDAYLMVFNPASQQPEVFQQRVLPFGSVASVTAFLRCSSALWAIGARLLSFIWTAYFDDFLSLEVAEACRHTDLCIAAFFSLLGWRVSHEKLLPYETICKVLGVQLDLRQSGDGLAWFGNTPERTSELISSIQEALDSGRLTRRDGERLRARLQFAAGQLFGRHLRLALGELNRHVTSGASAFGDTLAACLLAIVDFLADGEPRRVDGNFLDFVHVYVDASFSPDGYSGAGGLVLSSSGTLLDFFSEEIDAEFIASFKRSSQQTVIYELESLAVIVALCLFRNSILGKRVVLFTDNEGVRGNISRSRATQAVGSQLLEALGDIELQLHSRLWCERVASESNPADVLSRETVLDWQGLKRSRCHLCGGDLRDVLTKLLGNPSRKKSR